MVDILLVLTVTAIAYVLEDLAIARGWIPFASEVRGASSVLAGAASAFALLIIRGGSLADIGLRQPESWARVAFQGFAILIVFVAAQTLLPLLLSLFINLPAPDMSRYDAIAGNLTGAILFALVLPLSASIPEEIIYRGFFMERMSRIFGSGIEGSSLSVLFQALVFSMIHFQWGIGGMLMTLIMGIIWGTAFLLCGRNLWVVILAHSGGHILFVVQLYLAEPLVI